MERTTLTGVPSLICCIAAGVVKSKRVEEVMLETDRVFYCPKYPYFDSPQSIGFGATISAPHMVFSNTIKMNHPGTVYLWGTWEVIIYIYIYYIFSMGMLLKCWKTSVWRRTGTRYWFWVWLFDCLHGFNGKSPEWKWVRSRVYHWAQNSLMVYCVRFRWVPLEEPSASNTFRILWVSPLRMSKGTNLSCWSQGSWIFSVSRKWRYYIFAILIALS